MSLDDTQGPGRGIGIAALFHAVHKNGCEQEFSTATLFRATSTVSGKAKEITGFLEWPGEVKYHHFIFPKLL